MSLVKQTNPWLKTAFEDLFQEDRFSSSAAKSLGVQIPAVNIIDDENQFEIELAAPGKVKEDFKIELKQDLLVIESETKTIEKPEKPKYSRREFNYSQFKRSFTLPDSIDVGKIKAKYEQGILRVILPKKEESTISGKRLIEVA
ncbi:Hsp20/alpha crystallin family protein [Mesonia sp. HuA40]|uniref:Hsp20/alpha crystallin family protein n=1 Tax=Mesonia sp. HuA40 TaxID=2602761 RepID=UPI0011CB3A95|nr:Hsp20/alpha crystallin family protein [Mesonia sp. HuA40]TXK74281.1 Hsp20/alpha crystallin family protein [Mesonia sp. HuA40]